MNEYKTRLDEIRARCEAATPGPWKDKHKAGLTWVVNGTERAAVCYCPEENAPFIAAAKQDIPFLLAEVERLTQERDAAISDLRHADNCDVCKNNVTPVGCDAECLGCQLPCVCRDCRDESLWQWRGPEPGGEGEG